MIEKINTKHVQDFLETSSSKQPSSARAVPDNNDEDVSLQVNYASLIEKAMQTPQTDTNAVQRAQELLSSGQLETAENFRAAAEDIAESSV